MSKYTKEEKERYVVTLLAIRSTKAKMSIRAFAAMIGIKYYTFRDWYRDYAAKIKYQDFPIEKYLENLPEEQAGVIGVITDDDNLPFVRITYGGNHVL